MSPDKSNERDHYLLARLVRDVSGEFAKFKGGEIVKVRDIENGECTIERNLMDYLDPMTNMMTGVPTSALDFDV